MTKQELEALAFVTKVSSSLTTVGMRIKDREGLMHVYYLGADGDCKCLRGGEATWKSSDLPTACTFKLDPNCTMQTHARQLLNYKKVKIWYDE